MRCDQRATRQKAPAVAVAPAQNQTLVAATAGIMTLRLDDGVDVVGERIALLHAFQIGNRRPLAVWRIRLIGQPPADHLLELEIVVDREAIAGKFQRQSDIGLILNQQSAVDHLAALQIAVDALVIKAAVGAPQVVKPDQPLLAAVPPAVKLLRRPDEFVAHARFAQIRSEEHTSELQSLMRISYAVFCLKKKKKNTQNRQ